MTTNYFSISDMMTFLQCREKWDLSSPNRQSLRHKVSPRMYLTMGTAVHEAIDAQAEGFDPNNAAHGFLYEERLKQVEAYQKDTGFSPWPQEMENWDDQAGLTEAMVKQYFDHYGYDNPLADQGLRYLATEVPFKIDISGIIDIPDSYFVGTFDGIAVDEADRLWLVENKTYTQKPDLQDLMVHFQTTGYSVAWQLLTGLPLTGALYNGVAKKLIKEPRRLKDGSLSKDVSQQTTLTRYLSAMQADGIPPDEPGFEKILKKLTEIETQGDTRFFYREKFFYNEYQRDSWAQDFYAIAHEMATDPKIYRTVPYNGCGKQGADCWWRDLCFAKHTGQDHQALIDQKYTVDSYGTIQEVSASGLEPVMVTSIEDLREALRNHG